MTRQRSLRRLPILLTMLMVATSMVLAILACTIEQTGTYTHHYYRQDQNPAFWVCSTSTPTATATPEPEPPGWPPTMTWDPPNWPPTPYPSPTPYYMFGQFYMGQAVWMPYLPRSEPDKPFTMPVSTGYMWLQMTNIYTNFRGSGCYALEFAIKNFTGEPINFNAYDQIFLKVKGSGNMWVTTFPLLRAFGIIDIEQKPWTWVSTIKPGEMVTRLIPIYIGSEDEGLTQPITENVRVGIFLSPNEDRIGTSFATKNVVATSGDTAIYINPWDLNPECHYPPHPEVITYFPGLPTVIPYLNNPSGGRLSGGAPVGIPPCYYVTRGFGCVNTWTGVYNPGCPAEAPFWHEGIDLACDQGTPIVNVMDGVIAHWGWDDSGYGNMVSVQGGPFRMIYAHMSGFGTDMACFGVGNTCDLGSVAGYVGSTGNSTGPHLHWEMRSGGVPIDPQLYAGGQGQRFDPSRLLASAALIAMPTPTPLATKPPDTYPLVILLRDKDGVLLSGPTLHVEDIDHQPAGQCVFAGGQCNFNLPAGVYSLWLEGSLSDGTPVDPYGQVNVETSQSGQAEVHHGPLAVWLEQPGATMGLVLVKDAQGVAQPFFDVQPTGTPRALDPHQYVEASTKVPATVASVTPSLTLPPNSSAPANTVSSNFLAGGVFLVICGALVGAVVVGRWIRGRRSPAQSVSKEAHP